MNVVACYKIVADPQDITVKSDNSLDFERAERVIGEYDLVAIEEAATLAEATEGRAVLLSVGGKELTNSKLIKAALSRGAEELYTVVDEALEEADAFQTASVLAGALKKIDFDLVICGEGSADLYAQQVGLLTGSLLKVPVLNAVSKIEVVDGALVVERTLETEVEVLRVSLPAVLSVTSDINVPRIPQLKDILAAGKKSVTTWSLSDIGELPNSTVKVVSTLAPQNIERKRVLYDGASQEHISALALDIKTAK